MLEIRIRKFLKFLSQSEGYVQDYRSNKVRLPCDLESVLIRLMLSDGFLERPSPTSSVRISVNFGVIHALYLWHLYELFEPYINTGSRIISTFNVKTKKHNMVIRFKTVSLPLFKFYHELFYKPNSKGKYLKIIPQNIEQYMDPSMYYKLGI